MMQARSILFSFLGHKMKITSFRNFHHSIFSLRLLKTITNNNSLLLQTTPFKEMKLLPVVMLSKDISLNEVHALADKFLDHNEPTAANDPKKKNELVKLLKFLLSHGCTTNDIEEKCIEYIDSGNVSYVKAVLLTELDSDISTLLPLMAISHSTLRFIAKRARDDKAVIYNFPNRIAYLSHHLDVPLADLIPAVAKHFYLLTMNFNKLELKMNILKDAGISPKYIAQDLWIFNYNEKLLANRIAKAKEAGADVKPWMLRCSVKTFNVLLSKYKETQSILGGDDGISYFAKRLDCSEEYVKHIREKNKLLRTINIPKLEQILQFLFSKGYTPQEVRLFPRIFCASVQTLNERFEEASRYTNALPTMSELCMSSKRFAEKVQKQRQMKEKK